MNIPKRARVVRTISYFTPRPDVSGHHMPIVEGVTAPERRYPPGTELNLTQLVGGPDTCTWYTIKTDHADAKGFDVTRNDLYNFLRCGALVPC